MQREGGVVDMQRFMHDIALQEEGARMQEKKTIAPEQLHKIIRRIVEVAQPEKIILFGSAARGEMGPHSDVDLLVIKSDAHRLELTGQIYRHMHGVGAAVDIIVVTPEDVERYRHSHALVIAPALREGKVVYVD
jgi:predicted nucleotidyltransferase